MKYIREASDLHLDTDARQFHKTKLFDPAGEKIKSDMDLLWYPPEMDSDLDTAFIVAGDIWLEGRFVLRLNSEGDSWIKKMSRQFKYVIVVLGNHDYWDRNILDEPKRLKAAIADQGLTNVFLLENDVVVLDQVKFVGSTLWTDYNKHDNYTMMAACNPVTQYKDYQYIKFGANYRKIKPQDIYQIHSQSACFLFQNVKRDNPEQKVIVVTHMAPSSQSIAPKYREPKWKELNYLYYTSLENRILEEGQDIDYWFHGHMHHTTQYHIGHPIVILNARGHGIENNHFDMQLRIEL